MVGGKLIINTLIIHKIDCLQDFPDALSTPDEVV